MGDLVPLHPRARAPEKPAARPRAASEVARLVLDRCGGDTQRAIHELIDARSCVEQMQLREMEDRILGPRDGGGDACA